MSDDPVQRPVDVLERWEAAGSRWRVVGRSTAGVTIALLTCDGGEEVSRFTSGDADLLAFVGGRTDSDA